MRMLATFVTDGGGGGHEPVCVRCGALLEWEFIGPWWDCSNRDCRQRYFELSYFGVPAARPAEDAL